MSDDPNAQTEPTTPPAPTSGTPPPAAGDPTPAAEPNLMTETAPAGGDNTSPPPSDGGNEEPNLLAGGEGNEPEKGSEEAPVEATQEQVDTYLADLWKGEFKASDGSDIVIDRELVGQITPELIKAGIKQEQFAPVLRSLAEAQAKSIAQFAESGTQIIRDMATRTKETFGKDFPKVIKDAQIGGKAFFGDELWADLSSIPAFSNDHRIIVALAKYGRTITPDSGVVANGIGNESKDFATGWIESSNRNPS